jgi:XTP/dITP diphosphohydrolase
VTNGEPIGGALVRAVAITDRLRSPGGCPWDRKQTHASLSRYLLEESYETLDAIAADDLTALREELGDLLFQVLFQARLAEEAETGLRFSIEDVAGDLIDKLTRRHPHVFGPGSQSATAESVEADWDVIKRAEKQRNSVTEGIPLAQPSLALSAALIRRSAKAGVVVAPPSGPGFGERLFALAAEAVAAGVDPELALRGAALDFAEDIKAAER